MKHKIRVNVGPAVKELRKVESIVFDSSNGGGDATKAVLSDLRRAFANGPTGIFKLDTNRGTASGAGDYSCVLHLKDEVRNILSTLVRA